jgi:serine protease AprX
VDPRLLAEVAADRNITAVDLPRRLEAELNRSAQQIGAPQYRSRSGRTGRGVIVAVIDSEVAFRHPAFEDRVIQKRNLSRELWGNPDVHGTAVAGIIGANGPEIQGVAPGVTMYNYKVLATNRFLNGEDFDGALAIQQALEDGAHIANCSWGNGPAGNGTSREARAVNALSAHEGFIDFDTTLQSVASGPNHSAAQFVQPCPSRPVTA